MSKSTRHDTQTPVNEIADNGTYATFHATTRAAKKEKFIQAHHWGATVAEAARWAGIPMSTLYRWRDKDPKFAQAWTESRRKLVESLEREAFHRAANGSDRMLALLLKSYKPRTYNQRPSAPHDPHHRRNNPADVANLVERIRAWA